VDISAVAEIRTANSKIPKPGFEKVSLIAPNAFFSVIGRRRFSVNLSSESKKDPENIRVIALLSGNLISGDFGEIHRNFEGFTFYRLLFAFYLLPFTLCCFP